MTRPAVRFVIACLFGLCWCWTISALGDDTAPTHVSGGMDISQLFSGAGGQAVVWVLLWTESRKQRDEMAALKELLGTRPCVLHSAGCAAHRADDDPGADHRKQRKGHA